MSIVDPTVSGEGSQTDERQVWVKRVLNLDVPKTGRPQMGQARVDTKAKADQEKLAAFEKLIAPRSLKLDTSLSRTGPVKGLGSTVRDAEKNAKNARKAARDAALKSKWDETDGLLNQFDVALTALNDAYKTAGDKVDERLGRRVEKLDHLIESLQGTKLNSKPTTKSLDGVNTSRSDANKLTNEDERLIALRTTLKTADEAAIDATQRLQVKGNKGAVSGLEALLSSTASAIKKISDKTVKKDYETKLTEWKKQFDLARKETDPSEQKDKLDIAETDIRKLLSDAIGEGGGDLVQKQQEAFKEALKDRYGIKIKVPSGMTNTHFDKFYDMMALLPVEHTSQSKLKKLTYDMSSSGAAFGSRTVEMGNFDATDDWDYQNPDDGTPEPLNAFSINTLHEIGHSVDEKYGIMSGNLRGKAGYGGWAIEETTDIAKVFTDDYWANAGSATTVDSDLLEQLVTTALTGGGHDRPTEITDDAEWLIIEPMLLTCEGLDCEKWPWGKGKEVVFDGRAYHQSYGWEWVSYNHGSRQQGEVRDYQWRSPAEWFAELYAYTWYKKVNPPSGIDQAVAKYMYSDKR